MNVQTYIRKDPQIEVLEFVYAGTNLTDVETWLNTGTGGGYTAALSLSMPQMVIGHGVFADLYVNNGNGIAKDSNGKIFTISQELLACFYDLVE